MNRQVDVKALVSHVIRGDGGDRCRICMGDTSDGQVYLGDTVMMDGEKPVTLAEIVESITGVEVELESELPSKLCSSCTTSALSAAAYRTLSRKSSDLWASTVRLLESLPKDIDGSVYVLLTDDTIVIGKKTECFEGDGIDIDVDEIRDFENDCSIMNEIKKGSNKQARANQSDIINKIKITQKEKETKNTLNIASSGIICPDCKKVFHRPRDLYNHFKESTDYRRACYICADVMSQEELKEHLKNKHGRNLSVCKKCPALFTLRQKKSHLRQAHKRGSNTCGDCGRTFTSYHAYNGHTVMHIAKKCPSCNILFRNHRCYVYHVQKCCNLNVLHDKTLKTKSKIVVEVQNVVTEKIVKVGARGSMNTECICDYCNKKFAGKKSVAAHIQNVHLKNTHQPCSYCGKQLPSALMSTHIRTHFNSDTVFRCKQCGASMKTKLGYSQHLRIHTGEKPYACKLCVEKFSSSSGRSQHVQNKHKNKDEIVLRHKCLLCPAKFRLPVRLRRHVSTVHDEHRGQSFECPDCFIKFSSFRGVVYHRRKTHNNCEIGNKAEQTSLAEIIHQTSEHDSI